ncbi:MAG: hypothetical protein K2O00_03925 [Muribaculaceae bacterium]|nr:hypothetical protein [Muribaculaceae bacterium]
MVKQSLLFSSIILMAIGGIYAMTTTNSGTEFENRKLEDKVRLMPDSLFQQVEMEDLLDERVYLDLAKEGWTGTEIVSVMKKTVADKKTVHYKDGYVHYAKEVIPMIRRMVGGDTLAMIMDTVYTPKMRRSVESTVPADLLNAYWPPLEYIPPKDRPGTERNPGYFRQPKFNPSCGRICWITLHPEDPDKLYVGPDGGGIFKTDDCGKHWECITDRIPVRADRSCVNGYSIPVDPDDWDHVFAMMNNSAVYETCDGGQTWRKIVGATHKGFKRGDCFRDADNNLKFIGCTTTNWNSTLWISEDTCKTWTAVQVPDSIKDIHPNNGTRGLWFQYIVTDPTDRNKIYLPTSRSIMYFDDGAKSTMVNGKRVYNIKKMHFKVYDEAGNRRYATYSGDRGADVNNDAIFPIPANQVGDLVINPNNPKQWWFASGSSGYGANYTAVYRTEDAGKTWTTMQDLAFGIGSGCVFGNECASVWLGGFGVNFMDTDKLYGCSMSSAKSSDGGKTFREYHWAIPLAAEHTDGRFITVSASRHNADNHCIRSHKTGRVFRGSDGGMLMLDPNINNGEWCQIGGDMGQMLFYHVAVNEFGDQCIAGNTQDIDGQTYRYGRWGSWRGYEGSESWVNPYTGAVYFSGMGSIGWENMPLSSWYNAQTRADVVTGSWFVTRSGLSGLSFSRCDDLGKTVVKLEPVIGETVGWNGKYGLCRDKNRSTVFVVTGSNKIKRSIDGGNSFENVMFNGSPATFSGTVIATDPNNSDILYLGQQGKVNRLYVNESRFEPVGTGLPNIPCTQLFFHEGSGDLYFYHSGSAGIYILECLDKAEGRYASTWRFWTKGYNSGKSTNVEINYTTQEMVICDYGRGVWCADLEHPADRFFDNGFALKEYTFKDGRRTIGIDTNWTIPLYYYYKWTVNGEVVDNPYQYMRRALNPGDRIQLELTLRESPDVKTTSAVFVVPEVATAPDNEDNAPQGDASFNNSVVKTPGQVLYSNGQGRVDLGYFDYFFNDFTIDFWLKPISDGVILTNRTRDGDNKGWDLTVEAGSLKFEYSPRYSVNQPRYETSIPQTSSIRGGTLDYGGWNHIALTHERNGQIALYINGRKAASGTRIVPEATLNSSMILSLFGDGIEKRTIEASIDELKIWSMALDENQVRHEMYSTNADNKDGLVAYWSFNGGTLENDREAFSLKAPKSRVNAVTSHNMMTVPTCARYVSYEEVSSPAHTFRSGEKNVVSFSSAADVAEAAAGAPAGKYGVYVFDASQWQNEDDNLDTDYFDYHRMGYLIHPFDGIAQNDLILDFYPVDDSFNPDRKYRVYTSDINGNKQVWENIGSAEYNAGTGSIRLTGVTLSEVADKKILIVMIKPSIEVMIDGIGPDGVLPVYDESKSTYALSANILGNLPEPAGVYEIESDGILKPSGLYFAEGKATGELRLDLSKLGPLNTTVVTTLRGTNTVDTVGSKVPLSMIPMTIEVKNRIAPRTAGTAMKIDNGYAGVGSANNYKSLLNTNALTIMGWVRIDSAKVLQGDVSLMTFRDNGGVTGLRLRNGAFLLSQNGRDIWADEANFKVTAETALDRWHHYALVLGNGGISFYLDGMPFTNTSYRANTTSGIGGFYLGKNSGLGYSNSDDKFCGAYDQVAAWSRSLSQDEIIRYMYSGVPLNDKGLVTYLNMDYTDEEGRVRDVYNCEELIPVPTAALKGSVTFGEPTPIPFDAKAFYNVNDQESPVAIEFPAGKGRGATISVFRGAPYCYLNHDFQQYSAINQEFYGLTYKERLLPAKKPAETDSVTMTYRHRSIVGDEHLAVAMRRTGTLEHLAGFIPANNVEQGVATFRVPMSYLTEASEIMFFTYPDETGGLVAQRPAILQLSFPLSVSSKFSNDDENEEVPTLMLTGEETSIGVIADVMALSRNYDVPVYLRVNETTYAAPSQETIDFSATENQFNINIDVDKMDKFGINPITLNLEGATANELKLNVIFEPYVLLTLENGDHRDIVTPGTSVKSNSRKKSRRIGKSTASAQSENNTFRTTSPVANLELSAELIQGYMPEGEQVKLEVITDLDNSLNIGNGNLLKEEAVTYEPLEHHASDEGTIHEGWNLIGNPYLTNINLTKSQNVDYDAESVTKFIYQCDPITGNYKVFDMTDYNAAHQIHPFQSYFVQVMEDNAEFTITPIAKEVEPTKRTRAYKVTEKQSITFGLADNDKSYDRVTLDLAKDANGDFVTNEDAPKMWNMTESSPELYAMTGDDKETTVSTTPENVVSLGLKSPDDRELRLELLSSEGMTNKKVVVHDRETGSLWNPETDGPTYEFTAVPGADNNRFAVNISDNLETGAGAVSADNYSVVVDEHICTVSGLMGDAVIRIYTPAGLNIITQQATTPTFAVYLETGVYIVTIHEGGKNYTSKIVVQ